MRSASIIPSLVLGLSLSSPYLLPDQLDAFINRMLVSRISRRVLAQHHIALTEDFRQKARTREAHRVGIIHTDMKPADSIEKCATLLRSNPRSVMYFDPENRHARHECPQVLVEGHRDAKFAYIRDQFE